MILTARRPESGQSASMRAIGALCFALIIYLAACFLVAVRLEQTSSFNLCSPSESENSWQVFYNLYLNPHDRQLGIDIVKEQLGQIGHSYMTSNPEKPVILSYNTIGEQIDQKLMDRICRKNKIRCIHMKHFASAAEEVTLSKVYEFCNNHPENRVTYMHSKGSFHRQNGQNDLWRRAMMKSLTSKECLEPEDASCNVCSLVMNVVPFVYPAGNFFTADCSYVRKLLPVNVYLEKTKALHQEFLELRKNKVLTTDLYDQDFDWRFGTDQYVNEVWVASHPDVTPCDTSANPDIGHWMRYNYTDNDIAWAMAPRNDLRHIVPGGLSPMLAVQSLDDPSIIKREYSLLPGMLFRWKRYYGTFPGKHSWVWQRYPQGYHWLKRVQEDGEFAVDKFIAEWSQPSKSLTEAINALADNHCLDLDLGFSLDKMISSAEQIFITMPAMSTGSTLKTFTDLCTKRGPLNHFNNFISNDKARTDFLMHSLDLPPLITSHLYSDEALIHLAHQATRSTLVIQMYRDETDRLTSAIRHVIRKRICKGENPFPDLNVVVNATHCIVEEGTLHRLISSKYIEIGYGATEILTCAAYDAIASNDPNLVFVSYDMVDKLQKLLATHLCPELVDAPIRTSSAEDEEMLTYIRLSNGGEHVRLDGWLHHKKHLLEWALNLKENVSCQGKTKHLGDTLSACPDKAVRVTANAVAKW